MEQEGSARPGRGADEDRILEAVREAMRSIQYGSVLIKIHQGGVVAIETSTKVRFADSPTRS
jgi:hypothetical protein